MESTDDDDEETTTDFSNPRYPRHKIIFRRSDSSSASSEEENKEKVKILQNITLHPQKRSSGCVSSQAGPSADDEGDSISDSELPDEEEFCRTLSASYSLMQWFFLCVEEMMKNPDDAACRNRVNKFLPMIRTAINAKKDFFGVSPEEDFSINLKFKNSISLSNKNRSQNGTSSDERPQVPLKPSDPLTKERPRKDPNRKLNSRRGKPPTQIGKEKLETRDSAKKRKSSIRSTEKAPRDTKMRKLSLSLRSSDVGSRPETFKKRYSLSGCYVLADENEPRKKSQKKVSTKKETKTISMANSRSSSSRLGIKRK